METWMKEYAKQLPLAVAKYPDEYAYSLEEVPAVVERMRVAFAKRSYNKDSRAVKACCKVFGIKHTYTAINHFIDNHA